MRKVTTPNMALDALAQLSLAVKLNTMNPGNNFNSRSFPIAVTETRQGMYKEYTIDKVDDKSVRILFLINIISFQILPCYF